MGDFNAWNFTLDHNGACLTDAIIDYDLFTVVNMNPTVVNHIMNDKIASLEAAQVSVITRHL